MYPSTGRLPEGVTLVQSDYRISYCKCQEPTCEVFLVWYDHGQEDALGDFQVQSCECDEPTVCCTDHTKTFTCPYCEEEEEEQSLPKRTREDVLLEENESLKARLRTLEDNHKN